MTTSVLNTIHSPGIASDSELRLSPASVAQPISRTQELEHLAQADWHIAEVKSHIKRQRLRVEYALETGQPSELPDSMLHAFEVSLRAFQKHRELVLDQLKRSSIGCGQRATEAKRSKSGVRPVNPGKAIRAVFSVLSRHVPRAFSRMD
jgi:hypothetical protein